MLILFGHDMGMSLESKLLYLLDAGGPVRMENKSKYLRHEVVEFRALLRILMLHAVGA